jgi:cholesterol transport system auxiliary component
MIHIHLRGLALAAAAVLLAACSHLPDKPVRETMYDFGPVPAANAGAAGTSAGPLVLQDVEVGATLEGTDLLYRLAYADAFQLRPYAFARWSAPPGQLVRQRLSTHLGAVRAVLDPAAGASIARQGGAVPPVLRVELEQFDQVFDSQADSRGVIRVRCTLLENTIGGERVVAQRSFDVQRPAPTADAPGGVRALTAATDAVAQDIVAWLRQPR